MCEFVMRVICSGIHIFLLSGVSTSLEHQSELNALHIALPLIGFIIIVVIIVAIVWCRVKGKILVFFPSLKRWWLINNVHNLPFCVQTTNYIC